MASFDTDLTQVGYYVYPFKMQLPPWLPESTFYRSGSEEMSLRYYLVASYSPIQYARGFKLIYIFNPARI